MFLKIETTFFLNLTFYFSRKRNYFFPRIRKYFFPENEIIFFSEFKKIFLPEIEITHIFPEIEKIYSQIEWPQYASVQSGSETTCYGSTLVRVTWCCHLVCGNISNVKL